VRCKVGAAFESDKPHQSNAVVALCEDAGQVGAEGVGDDDEVTPPWVPQKEDGHECESRPVAKLAAPGFDDEALEVCRRGLLHSCLGKASAEPGGGVGQSVLPCADAKDVLIE